VRRGVVHDIVPLDQLAARLIEIVSSEAHVG
jgi:hypothetical protein